MVQSMKSFARKLVVVIAACAMAVALIPAAAFATTSSIHVMVYNTSTQDWDDHPVTLTATSGTKYGYLFKQSGTWRVAATTTQVNLDSAIADAGNDATAAWTTGSTLYFSTSDTGFDYYNGVSETGYNKYYPTYSELHATSSNFYGDTTSTVLGSTATANAGAVLSLDAATSTISSDASTALAGITCTATTYPRLLWGFASTTETNVGGNRFPSGIIAIYIVPANGVTPW